MKKGQVYEGIVEETLFPNKGIVNIKDNDDIIKKILVKGALKGQKVSFSVKKVRKDKSQGRLLEVVDKSPLEDSVPNCPHFGQCGGCSYQTLSYKNQLELKENQVKNLLDSVSDDYTWEGIKASPIQWEYRNKMEFSFGDEVKDGPLALGMHKKNSFYDIVNVVDCKIVSNDCNEIVKNTLKFCTDRGYTYYKKMAHVGLLRHLLIRRSIKNDDILVAIVTTTQEEFDAASYKDMILELKNSGKIKGNIAGILHILNDSLSDVVQSDKTNILYGNDYFYEDILGLRFKVSTFSFFQTNSLGAEVLYNTARGYIPKADNKVVFDLYTGTGTIAQMMASNAKKVVGVEIVEEAVESAKENTKLNKLDNCEFIAGDVLKVIDDLKDKPDIIIVDPPRSGINPKALPKIASYGVSEIVYISCNPVSLVENIEQFKEYGYKLKKACAVDMYPNNLHCEVCVKLVKEDN